jgi:hypothetical protein
VVTNNKPINCETQPKFHMDKHSQGFFLERFRGSVFLINLLFFNFVNSLGDEGWIWIAGDSTVDSIGRYGLQSVENASNQPGARSRGVTWSNEQGLFLFGGYGYDSQGEKGMSDLYNSTHKQDF